VFVGISFRTFGWLDWVGIMYDDESTGSKDYRFLFCVLLLIMEEPKGSSHEIMACLVTCPQKGHIYPYLTCWPQRNG
jgi:hypothetical protein